MTCAIDSQNYIHVVGTSCFMYGNANITLLRYDPTGNLIWKRFWDSGQGYSGDDIGVGVAHDQDDNIYVTGNTLDVGDDEYNIVTLKYDKFGTFQWQRIWGGNDDDSVNNIAVDSEGNIYVCGSTDSYSSDTETCLLKYSSTGALLWYKTWKGYCYDSWCGGVGNDLFIDSSDNIYVVADVIYPSEVMAVLKYSSSGKLLEHGGWENNHYSTDAWCGCIDEDGEMYIGGACEDDDWDDIIIIKNPDLTYNQEDEGDDDDDEPIENSLPM